MSTTLSAEIGPPAYRHEAMLYAGLDDFLDGTGAFIAEGLRDADPMLVVVGAAKIEALRARLGPTADEVAFVDMADVGTNPACIIPAWQDFLDRHAGTGRRLRGIGEPLTIDRSPAAAVECHRHEALLNLAFTDSDFWLLCPYDTDALAPAEVDEACRTHPLLRRGTTSRPSEAFNADVPSRSLSGELPAAPADAASLGFRRDDLHRVRDFAKERARRAGVPPERVAELTLAVSEIAANSVRHAGGTGTILVWREGDVVVCEVRDRGHIDDPLVGRVRPSTEAVSGRGVWLANQLCDLVQVRSSDAGTSVRLHMSTSDAGAAGSRRA